MSTVPAVSLFEPCILVHVLRNASLEETPEFRVLSFMSLKELGSAPAQASHIERS